MEKKQKFKGLSNPERTQSFDYDNYDFDNLLLVIDQYAPQLSNNFETIKLKTQVSIKPRRSRLHLTSHF